MPGSVPPATTSGDGDSDMEDMIDYGTGDGGGDAGGDPPLYRRRFDYQQKGLALLTSAAEGVGSSGGVYDDPIPRTDDSGRPPPGRRCAAERVPVYIYYSSAVAMGIDALHIRGFISWKGVQASLPPTVFAGTESLFLTKSMDPDSFSKSSSKSAAVAARGGERLIMICSSTSLFGAIPYRFMDAFWKSATKTGIVELPRQQQLAGFPRRDSKRSDSMLQFGGKGQVVSSESLVELLRGIEGLFPKDVSVKAWGQSLSLPIVTDTVSEQYPLGIDIEATQMALYDMEENSRGGFLANPHRHLAMVALNDAVEAFVDVFVDVGTKGESATIYNSEWPSAGNNLGSTAAKKLTAAVCPVFLQAQGAGELAAYAVANGSLSGFNGGSPCFGGSVTALLENGGKQHQNLFGTGLNGVRAVQVSAYHSSSVHVVKSAGLGGLPSSMSMKVGKGIMSTLDALTDSAFDTRWKERLEATVVAGGDGCSSCDIVVAGLGAIEAAFKSGAIVADGSIRIDVLKQHHELGIRAAASSGSFNVDDKKKLEGEPLAMRQLLVARNGTGFFDMRWAGGFSPFFSKVDFLPLHVNAHQSFPVAASVVNLSASDPRRTPTVISADLPRTTAGKYKNVFTRYRSGSDMEFSARVPTLTTSQAAHDKSHAVMPGTGGMGVKKYCFPGNPNAEALAAVDADMVTIRMPDVVLMLAISAAYGGAGLLEEAKAAAACPLGTLHPLTAALKYLAKLNYELPVYNGENGLVSALNQAVELQQRAQEAEVRGFVVYFFFAAPRYLKPL